MINDASDKVFSKLGVSGKSNSLEIWFDEDKDQYPVYQQIMYLRDYESEGTLTCDQVFALYLEHVSLKVNEKFY